MDFHQNPNPNWTNFPANMDPPMDFELSDYLMLEDGVDHQLGSLSPQSFQSPENFEADTGAGGSSETSGATSRNHDMQVIIIKPSNLGYLCVFGKYIKTNLTISCPITLLFGM